MFDRFKTMNASVVEPFWASPERYLVVRNGFRGLCNLLGKKPPFFHRQMQDRFPARFVPSRSKTLSRFLNDDATKTLGKAAWLSALLVTCEDIIRCAGIDTRSAHRSIGTLVALSEQFRAEYGIDLTARDALEKTPDAGGARAYPRALLENIVRHIHQPSETSTLYPEYPPGSPRWPATPCQPAKYEGRAFLLKDESQNPSGTHKDRWAWEKLVRYKKIIAEALRTEDQMICLPAYSMISSGSAALALQSVLRLYQLPDLHVAMSDRARQRVVDKLTVHGAKVAKVNLAGDILSEKQVCAVTGNADGIDVTPRHARESFDNHHYDWLVYEMLEQEPKHIFVPFGSGGLFANIVYTIAALKGGRIDDRLRKGASSIENVNVYGATSNDPWTNMEMLFAHHRPTLPGIEQDLSRYVVEGFLGSRSAIVDVGNDDAIRAVQWASSQGIRTDYSGAAALALFMKMFRDLPRDETVLVVNTGTIALPPP